MPTDNIERNLPVTVRYFASVREGLGMGQEMIDLPDTIATVGDFFDWMRSRGPAYDAALSKELRVRAAVDRLHANHETSVRNAEEIAIFPMMTGG